MLRRILIILGALVALLPYLGLPRSWDNILFTFAGLAIVVLLVLSRRSVPSREVAREETPAIIRDDRERKHGITTTPQKTMQDESRRSRPPLQAEKLPEARPKTEVRRTPRVSPPRTTAVAAPTHRGGVANHSTVNDVVLPPQVRPSPPPVTNSNSALHLTPPSFEQKKPTPIRRQKPKSAEDFLKGDSA